MNLLTQAQAIVQTQITGVPQMTPVPSAQPTSPSISPVGEQAIDNISTLAGQVAQFIRNTFPDLARADRLLLINTTLSVGVAALAGALFALCGRLQATFMKRILRAGVVIAAAIGLLTIWVPGVLDWFETPEGGRIGGSALTILSVIVVNALLWEGANRLLLRYYLDQTGTKSQRLRTLMPLIRRAILILLIVISALTIMTEIGINIAPLLAGAGVIGIAVGFGSQKLVQDCITGLFIILEDAVALGDSVTIGTHAGVVEDITLRTIRLRDVEGAVHILPFSEVRTILNRSKGYAYAVIDVNVAYGSDLVKVEETIKGIIAEIKALPQWHGILIDDVEIMGLESLGDSAITFRFRQRTPAGKQVQLKREILSRIHSVFAREGIDIPFPTVMQVTRGDLLPPPASVPPTQ